MDFVDVSDMAHLVAERRGALLMELDENPKLAAIAAYDAITGLLVEIVKELRGSSTSRFER